MGKRGDRDAGVVENGAGAEVPMQPVGADAEDWYQANKKVHVVTL